MLKYETLLKEEGVKTESLPKEIKQKISGLKLTVGRMAKNPALQENVDRQDIAIADMIQTFLEKDLPEPTPAAAPAATKKPVEPKETPEEIAAKKEKADADAKEKAAAKVKADAEASELAEKNKVTELQNQIVTKMNASSTRSIERSDLENILGRKVSDKETVGTLRLYKAYLTTRYKAM